MSNQAVTRGDPTGVIVEKMLGEGSGTLIPGVIVEKVALSFTGTANGSLISWQNQLPVGVLATAMLNITTAGTGTAGCDVGVGTLGGSSDNILDAGRVDTANAVSAFGTGGGTNGKPWRIMTAKGGTLDYITGKMTEVDATAAGAGYILYVPIS